MEIQHRFGAQDLAVVGLCSVLVLFSYGNCDPSASSSDQPYEYHGCFPCSHEYLTGSYFDDHNALEDSDSQGCIVREIGSGDLCNGLLKNIDVLRLADLNRHLSGEGSHRHLLSTMRFEMQLDAFSWLDNHICEAVIIERLPNGVFADPFELQHLVRRGVFVGAAVFGDTNLELPSALSNRSTVEIHMEIGHNFSSAFCEHVVQLPLHARYPPLDANGYARVTIGRPDLFLRCRQKYSQHEACSWSLRNLGAGSANSVTWHIPCGNQLHTGLVSGITFVSSLVCSLLIVSSAIFFPRNNIVIKTS